MSEAVGSGESRRWAREVAVMAEATSYFVQEPYASEALDALVAAGWRIASPAGARTAIHADDLRKIAWTLNEGHNPDGAPYFSVHGTWPNGGHAAALPLPFDVVVSGRQAER